MLYNRRRAEFNYFFILRELGMPRGREKDRKTRKKHRKNVQRVKELVKTRRASAKRGKKG